MVTSWPVLFFQYHPWIPLYRYTSKKGNRRAVTRRSDSGQEGRRGAGGTRRQIRRIVAVRDRRWSGSDRFWKRRHGERRLLQGRRSNRNGFDGYEELNRCCRIGTAAFDEGRPVARPKMVSCRMPMPADVGVHPCGAVVVVMLVVQMRVKQRRTQSRQLQSGGNGDGSEPLEHSRSLFATSNRPSSEGSGAESEDFLNSRSVSETERRRVPQYARMRTIQWLFVVGVLLFVTGIGFVIAGAREARSTGPAPEPVAAGTPVASIRQIMLGITAPAAATVYNSVGTVINAEGITDTAPQNDEEWIALGNSAAALAESGNLLLMPGRSVDNGDWVKMTQAFIEASTQAVKAAEAKSTEGILSAGSDINETCDTCHERYAQ